MAEVVRWLIGTLTVLAQSKGYGTIKINVQGGQIEFVHLEQSWTMNTLPVQQKEPGTILSRPPV